MKSFISLCISIFVVIAVGVTIESFVGTPETPLLTSPVQATKGIVDQRCQGGHGIQIVNHSSDHSELAPLSMMAATSLPNGETIVAIGPFETSNKWVTQFSAFNSDCTPALGFGIRGVTDFTNSYQVSVSVLAPTATGQILIGANFQSGSGTNYQTRTFVGRMNPTGEMDSNFGNKGWSKIPWSISYFPGAAIITAIDETSDGQVLVGDTDSGGCCGFNWVSKLAKSGRIEKSFGSEGKVALPRPVEDVEISKIVIATNGEILAVTSGGHMGIVTTYPTALTPKGKIVSGFEKRFQNSLVKIGRATVFDADLLVTKTGFLMIGTKQYSLYPTVHDPSETGFIALFNADGTLDSKTTGIPFVKFSAPIERALALDKPNGGLLLFGTPLLTDPHKPRYSLSITALSTKGVIDSSYGVGGHADIELPYSIEQFPTVTVLNSGRTFTVVTANDDSNTFTFNKFYS